MKSVHFTSPNSNRLTCILFVYLKDGSVAKRVLLLGEAGNGKSVLAKKIALDWSRVKEHQENECHTSLSLPLNTEEKAFVEKFKILLIIDLSKVCKGRFLQVVKNQIAFGSKVDVSNLVNYLDDIEKAKECLLILDGYDEYDDKVSDDVNKILKGEYLHANILITSRHNSKELHNIEKECVIRGFTEELAKQHATKLLKVMGKSDFDLDAILKPGAKIKKLMLNPFICTCMCMLAQKQNKLTEENTVTFIFYSIIQLIMGNPNGLTSSDNVEKKLLKTLGGVAFKALIEKKTNFIIYDSNIVQKAVKLGLLAANSQNCQNAKQKLFSFEHQSVQDFLAAVHVVHGKKSEFRKLRQYLTNLHVVSNASFLVYFICGLSSKIGSKLLSHIEQIAQQDSTSGILCPQFSSYAWTKQELTEGDKVILRLCDSSNITPFILDCLSEMKSGKNKNDKVRFPYAEKVDSKEIKVPPELNFASVPLETVVNLIDEKKISFSDEPTFILANNEHITNKEVNSLEKIQGSVGMKSLKTFHMANIDGFRATTKFDEWVSKMKNLKCLKMEKVSLNTEDMKHVIKSFSDTLKQLYFDQVELTGCEESVAEYLNASKCLKVLVMKNTTFPANQNELLQAIGSLRKLEKLVLTKTALSKADNKLSDCFKKLSSLCCLILDNCGLSLEQMKSLSEQLKTSGKSLFTLNVSRNRISGAGDCFSDAIGEMQKLKDLSMDECGLKSEQIKRIFQKLSPAIQIVSFNNNNTDSSIKDFLKDKNQFAKFKDLKYIHINIALEETDDLKSVLSKRKLSLIVNEEDEKNHSQEITELFQDIGYVCEI